MEQSLMEEVRRLRCALHNIPELAFYEKKTKEMLMTYLSERTDLPVVDRGTWFYAVWEGKTLENAIAFRADFDAVAGADGQPGHFCGHDGHSATLAGFGRYLSEKKPDRTVYLIFQPAEEIGQGAVLCRELIREKNISEIYGFHNIPGYPLGSVLLLPHTFACASTGMELAFLGTPAHAAYPEAGKNPADVIAKLILYRNELLNQTWDGMVLITVIGADLGSAAYGVSAGKGALRLTVRAEHEADFQKIIASIRAEAERFCAEAGIALAEVKFVEPFPATENNLDCVRKVEQAASLFGKTVIWPAEPFRWSEDFGAYLQLIPGAFFGVGSGENCPQLHTADYEFPDAVSETVLEVYAGLL